MVTEHVRRLVAGFAVVGVLAAGCSDAEGDPPGAEPSATEQSPTTSATPEETASPGPGPTPWPEPTRPAAMERDDIEGAKAAAEYFLELYPYAFATGELEDFREMSHPDCKFCRGAADRVTDLYTNGGYAVGGEFSVSDIVARESGEENVSHVVGLSGTEAASTEYSREGEVIRTLGGGEARYTFELIRDDQRWLVMGGAVEAIGEAP